MYPDIDFSDSELAHAMNEHPDAHETRYVNYVYLALNPPASESRLDRASGILCLEFTCPQNANLAFNAAEMFSRQAGRFLGSRKPVALGRWEGKSYVLIALDQFAAQDPMSSSAILSCVRVAFSEQGIAVSDAPIPDSAPSCFLCDPAIERASATRLCRLRTDLTARHMPEALSVTATLEFTERTRGLIRSASLRPFVRRLKELRRTLRKSGGDGPLPPEIVSDFKALFGEALVALDYHLTIRERAQTPDELEA